MKHIYIAHAYSGTDDEMEGRYQKALEAVARLIRNGDIPYSPIVSFHESAKKHGLPKNAAFYMKANKYFIKSAKEVLVLHDDGNSCSIGLQMELLLARENNVPIIYEPTIYES